MQDYVAANKQAYQEVASEYLLRVGKPAEPLDRLAGIPLRLAQQYFEGKLSVLEIGPGSGEVCAYYEDHDCVTTAIDVAPKILANVQTVSPQTKLIEADILSYDLPKAHYELIYCGALIHLFTIKDAAKILNNVYNALKPGGILFINTTIHPESSEGYYEKHDYNQKVKRYRHRYTKAEFEGLVKEAGFTITDQLTTDEKSRGKYWQAYICSRPR